MRILIIDNDNKIREGLKTMLSKGFPDMLSIQEADGVESGLNQLNAFNPELIFLDVEMDDGTGFDFIKKASHHNFQLIFITAHDKYAVDAIKMSAIDFLQKPIDQDELAISVEKAKKGIQNSTLKSQVEFLTNALINNHTGDKKIALKDRNAIHFVKIQNIIRCEADGTYTKFIIENSAPLLLSKSLKEFEDLLSGDNFIRCHHSHLINVSKIIRLEKTDGGSLVLENNEVIPISQRKKEQILAILSKR